MEDRDFKAKRVVILYSQVLVYIFASIVDNIRIIFFEHKWEKSKICNKIDKFY